MATPYDEELNLLVKEFFETHGIRVINIKGLEIYSEDKHCSPLEANYNGST